MWAPLPLALNLKKPGIITQEFGTKMERNQRPDLCFDQVSDLMDMDPNKE